MSLRKGESKGGEENDVSWRVKQKLSQKAVRERKAARIQQLEQQLATVTQCDDSTKVNQLLKTNTRLRHAFLDTRKKLASLSATAAQLSQRIKDELDRSEDIEHGSEIMKDSREFSEDFTFNLWNVNLQASWPSPDTSSTESICRNLEPEHFENPDLNLIDVCASIDGGLNVTHSVSHFAEKALVSRDTTYKVDRHDKAITGLFPTPCPSPKLRVFSRSILSEHLDHIHGLLRLGGASGNNSSMPHIVESMLAAFLHQGWPSMRYWFDATQSRPLGARVLWWQTSSSQEAAIQVPPGNTPTLIQLSQLRYPCIIDWVPHLGLRDQLILNYRSYDVDQVICDMTNAFVVEVEECGSSRFQKQSDISTPISYQGYSYSLMDLVERTLISTPLDIKSSQEPTLTEMLQNTTSLQNSLVQYPVHRFKLDPRFFEKYPALYDNSAESKYRPKNPPGVQRSQLPLPFTTESEKEYMNAMIQAKSTDLMV